MLHDTPVPDGWPEELRYVQGLINFPEENANSSYAFIARSDLMELRFLPHSHPAYQQGQGRGVFAKKHIPPETTLGEYSGVYRLRAGSKGRYLLAVDDRHYNIDALVAGNEVRVERSFPERT
jgi:hypothetical protein